MTDMNTWTVGTFRAEDIPDKDRALVEKLMTLGVLMKDSDGKGLHHRLPPALAWAIISIMRLPFPEGAARHYVAEFTPRPVPAKKRTVPGARKVRDLQYPDVEYTLEPMRLPAKKPVARVRAKQ